MSTLRLYVRLWLIGLAVSIVLTPRAVWIARLACIALCVIVVGILWLMLHAGSEATP